MQYVNNSTFLKKLLTVNDLYTKVIHIM